MPTNPAPICGVMQLRRSKRLQAATSAQLGSAEVARSAAASRQHSLPAAIDGTQTQLTTSVIETKAVRPTRCTSAQTDSASTHSADPSAVTDRSAYHGERM